MSEDNEMSDWPCLLAKLLVQQGGGYRHDHPFWDFGGLTSMNLRKIEQEIRESVAGNKDQPNERG